MTLRFKAIKVEEARRRAAAKLDAIPDTPDAGLTSGRQLVFAIYDQLLELKRRKKSWPWIADFVGREFGAPLAAQSVRKYVSQETVRRRNALGSADRKKLSVAAQTTAVLTVAAPSVTTGKADKAHLPIEKFYQAQTEERSNDKTHERIEPTEPESDARPAGTLGNLDDL